MKKYSSILIIILVTGFFANAQSKSTKKADRLFAKFEFVEAAKAYEEVISKGNGSEYVYAQLAEAYYNVFNTVDAEKWYAKTLETLDEKLKSKLIKTSCDEFVTMSRSD